MKTRFFKPTKITWLVFVPFIVILVLGASQRDAIFDEVNDRDLSTFYTILPQSIRDLPLVDIWIYTIVPIVVMLGGNIWFYGGSTEPASFVKEVFFISLNVAYFYVISSTVSYVIKHRKHDGWKHASRNNRILQIVSIVYPSTLLLLGMYGFYFVPHDVGYAPSPQESFFFKLTTLGSISTIILFIVVGTIYWVNNQKPKRFITAVPFALFFVIVFSLLTGILPKGANA